MGLESRVNALDKSLPLFLVVALEVALDVAFDTFETCERWLGACEALDL